MANYLLTQDEKLELIEALVTRFRLGEIGPVTFRMECQKLGVDRDTIDGLRDQFSDECADNMRKVK